MPDQLLLDVCSVLIRYVVQQVADTPCHMYLFCVLEVRTVNAGGRNTHWVYDADVGRVSGSEVQPPDAGSYKLSDIARCSSGRS